MPRTNDSQTRSLCPNSEIAENVALRTGSVLGRVLASAGKVLNHEGWRKACNCTRFVKEGLIPGKEGASCKGAKMQITVTCYSDIKKISQIRA